MSEDDLLAKASGIHERVITMDTHCDIDIANFTDAVNYTQDLNTQISLPKMKTGGLDVAWFVVYTGQDALNTAGYQQAYENAVAKFEAIHRLCNSLAPNDIELAYNSDDVRRIAASGKKVAMIGIENGYPVGEDISKVKKFYDMGGRYMSLSHNGHSQLCDSHTGEEDGLWLHNGLSKLGKEVIAQMNKWGMMIDVSHPSKKSMQDIIALTKAPVIASHSSARALCDHSRNLDDQQLQWIKDKGGVVQTVAFKSYLNTEKYEARQEAQIIVAKEIAPSLGVSALERHEVLALPMARRREYFHAILKKAPLNNQITSLPPAVHVIDLVDHIDYLVEKIGIDHVGISSDFDGGGGIAGWDDASETFNVTLELVKRGYTEAQIEQLWSGNLLRVLDEVQAVAAKIQAESD